MTLSSDLGAAYSAQVKAVLARSIGPGRLVELTHELPAHRVPEAAFLLRAMAQGFPAGTVHLAIVDPGVGGRRAPLAISCADGSRLVGPDNGVLFPLAESLGRPQAFRLDPGRVGGPARLGTTFDGRDLFAPAAARLAEGDRPDAIGSRVRPTEYRVPEAVRRGTAVLGQTLHVDHFGNLITNIPTGWVHPRGTRLTVTVGRRTLRTRWTTSYEEIGRGRLGALGSSFGTLELAVSEGNAARRLRAHVGTRVAVRAAAGRSAASQSVNSERPRLR
ncbi:MAG: S-adenosyl-l-methionine hydroxide adenosyltransferase family protein [Thermoplasmata archaeon]